MRFWLALCFLCFRWLSGLPFSDRLLGRRKQFVDIELNTMLRQPVIIEVVELFSRDLLLKVNQMLVFNVFTFELPVDQNGTLIDVVTLLIIKLALILKDNGKCNPILNYFPRCHANALKKGSRFDLLPQVGQG